MQCTFLASEPGVPYNVTVRAILATGLGEPVSIVVFAVQQGNYHINMHKGTLDVSYLSKFYHVAKCIRSCWN